MFTHDFDPVLFNFGSIYLRWYSLAYIFGILIGWWYGKKIILKRFRLIGNKFSIEEFDDLVTYLIVSIIIGGRIGYVIFYNPAYFISNPLAIFKVWEGGMSFHGALAGIIIGTYFFSVKRDIDTFFLLDIVACVSPIGIFLGRVANFINGELVGKVTDVPWAVIFPNIDMFPRHPSQLYEAILEGLILFLLLNFVINKKNYITGKCSYLFLIAYGVLRIISEFFREPDAQIGYFFGLISMGTLLSLIMILFGFIIIFNLKNRNEI
tara:strand:- start:656 stop:1450 length:795 start_codon:yes stop_codon:yes gene_type:complete